jgi:hypothetical protein
MNQFKKNDKKLLRIKRKGDKAIVMFDPYGEHATAAGTTEQRRCFEVPFKMLEGLVNALR